MTEEELFLHHQHGGATMFNYSACLNVGTCATMIIKDAYQDFNYVELGFGNNDVTLIWTSTM